MNSVSWGHFCFSPYCNSYDHFNIDTSTNISPEMGLLEKIIQNRQACIGRSECEWINPLILTAAKTSLTILMKSFRSKAQLAKYLKEKC